jgi:DNA-directed RNA polymerase subunit H (RpoH/RPB5)
MNGINTNIILSIYKSRNTILEFMKEQNYDTTDYEDFSINEIDAMYVNSQLDLLLSHENEKKKVYIKYYFSLKQTTKQIRPANLDNIIEDLYYIDNVLNKNDTLIIIIDEEPNDTIIKRMKYLYETDGIFVVIHNIKRLQFNIFEHSLIPKVKILTGNEVDEIKTKLNLKSLSQLPEISRFDPLALAMNMRPKQVAKFVRSSPTALNSTYYRICI